MVLPAKLYLIGGTPQPRRAAQQTADARQQDGQLRRLRQVIVGAGREAIEDIFGTAAGRKDQHRHELPGLTQLRNDGEAVLARQHDIQHHEIEAAVGGVGQLLERRLAGLDDLDPVSLGLEVEAQPLGQMLLVLDDQDPRRTHARAARGNSSVKVLPRPAPWLSANARPPCLRATVRTMNRPRPLPFARTDTPLGTR